MHFSCAENYSSPKLQASHLAVSFDYIALPVPRIFFAVRALFHESGSGSSFSRHHIVIALDY